jgi:DNA-binding NarL/FixJ family response regulator
MEMARLGASGYILKDSPPSELVRAIEAAHAGDAFFSPRISRHLLKSILAASAKDAPSLPPELSQRERQVLRLIAEGLTSKQIAARLGITFRTVESHRDRIQKKLDIHSTAGLTKFAVSAGIVEAR